MNDLLLDPLENLFPFFLFFFNHTPSYCHTVYTCLCGIESHNFKIAVTNLSIYTLVQSLKPLIALSCSILLPGKMNRSQPFEKEPLSNLSTKRAALRLAYLVRELICGVF